MSTLAAMRPAAAEPPAPPRARVAGFRTKVLLLMMLVVFTVTALALSFTQRRLAATVERGLEREFQAQFDVLHKAQEIRQAALVERCRALGRRPRIQQALEDNALDLLYDSAKYELADLLVEPSPGAAPSADSPLAPGTMFYRLLARNGAVIAAPGEEVAGVLTPAEEKRLTLPALPEKPQIGYLEIGAPGAIAEVIATQIFNTATGDPIGGLVLGSRPLELRSGEDEMTSGIWVDGRLHASRAMPALARAVGPVIARAAHAPVRITIDGLPHLVFARLLNPASHFSPAYELGVFPLSGLVARQAQLRWQVLGAGGLLLLVGLVASHFASVRLAAPVERLAVDSERSARFSADASHQLKTPVTVLRAGLEELLTRDNLTPDECHEISALIHQTYRLSSLIEDLLLLSRMDAGRLKLELHPLNLTQLIEASLDDLSALPDELELEVENEFPPALHVLGEKRYTAMILQNLLENARKYNRRGGRIRVVARRNGELVSLVIANTGQPIAAVTQAHIFERFHRGAMGENVPGYGLGLNLARELARLHGGELRLRRSDAEWTEFELTLRTAEAVA